MTPLYNVLGNDIVINAIVYASDVDEVQRFVVQELARRGIAATGVTTLTPGTPGYARVVQGINDNLRRAGYSGSAAIKTIPTASEIRDYVNYARNLYNRILKS